MTYTFEGTIKEIFDTVTYEKSGFKKREIVLTSNDEKYAQDIKFEFLKESADLLDAYKVGDVATVAFALRGNEYNGKYYTNLNGIKIGVAGKDGKVATKDVKTKAKVANTDIASEDTEDDLPF